VKLEVGDRMLDAGALRNQLTAFDKIMAFVHATVTPLPMLERLKTQRSANNA
jgi:hypothetical protein